MTTLSIGDRAQHFAMQKHQANLKAELELRSLEVASGRKSAQSLAGRGESVPLAGLEHKLAVLEAYRVSATEVGLLASSMQTALANVQDSAGELASAMLTASSSANPMLIDATAVDARFRFEGAIAAFNTRIADRHAFSGQATDQLALADAATMLADLQLAITGALDAASVTSAVDNWFDLAGGGFETVGYTGSAQPFGSFRLSENDDVALGVTAADAEIREVLKGLALGALVAGGALSGNTAERAALMRQSGETLVGAQTGLAVVRSRIGSAEARIDGVSAANQAEKTALSLARAELVAVDPFEAATELERVRGQLEALYTVTARLAGLSLTAFLR